MSGAGDQERIAHEQILAEDDGAVESCAYLAHWHFSRHSYRTARKYLGHLSALKRTNVDVWYALCVCSCAGGDLEEATVALQEAERLSGEPETNPRAILCKGLIAERSGEHREALAYLESIVGDRKEIASTPSDSISDQQSQQSASPGGVGMSSSSVDGEGGDGKAAESEPIVVAPPKDIKGEALLHIAAVKKDMGDLEDAIAVCNRVLADSPSQFLQANVLCLQGVIYEVKKDYQNAEIAYRKCCSTVPTHIAGLERLGRLYLRFRETLEAAVQCFQRSLGNCPQNATVWYLLGRCYMASAQYEDAFLAYNEAVNCEPNEPRVWVSLGVLYYSHGQHKESLGMFARALRLKPKCVEAWYNLGIVYEVNGNQKEADKAYVKAKENGFSMRLDQVGLVLVEPSAT